MDLGQNIQKYRKLKGITQKQLADHIGVTSTTIQNYENNRREPNVETLNKIAKVLGTTINDLAGDKKTIMQNAAETLLKGGLERGLTFEEVAKHISVPVDDLECMLNNKHCNPESVHNLFKFFHYTKEEIIEALMLDTYINTIYNNKKTSEKYDLRKKFLLDKGEKTLSNFILDFNDPESSFDIIVASTGKKVSKDDIDAILTDMNKFLEFLKQHKYPIEKLDSKTLMYLREKILSLLDFEFYKLEKNDYQIPDVDNKESEE